MHLNIVKGDYLFREWEEDAWKKFCKQTHYLRVLGYRKIDQEGGGLNYYEYYRKKGKRKIIMVTMMLC